MAFIGMQFDDETYTSGTGTISTTYATESSLTWVKQGDFVYVPINLHLKNISSFTDTVIGSNFPPSLGMDFNISQIYTNDSSIYGRISVSGVGQLVLTTRGTSFGANATTVLGTLMYRAA